MAAVIAFFLCARVNLNTEPMSVIPLHHSSWYTYLISQSHLAILTIMMDSKAECDHRRTLAGIYSVASVKLRANQHLQRRLE